MTARRDAKPQPTARPPAAQRHHRAIADALARWFARNQRDFPWRRRRSGYTGLVAEIMLQQTQASRVAERFPRFLASFPSVKALARASEDQVLKAWEGLGYYRRALMLRAAAGMIVGQFGGRVPRTCAGLRRLPGVGRYTAGAIASIVYGEREAIVDGNVRRVLTRLHEIRRDDAWTWNEAQRLVDAARDPGTFNEALMELGATVCTPRQPRCGDCPVKRWCRGCVSGLPAANSMPARQARKRIEHHHAVVMRRADGAILLEQRDEGGMWRKMWQTPTIECAKALRVGEVKRAAGVPMANLHCCGEFRHETTHRRIVFHVYRASASRLHGRWCDAGELARLPMSNAQRKVLALSGIAVDSPARRPARQRRGNIRVTR